jgi:hypothetical protein
MRLFMNEFTYTIIYENESSQTFQVMLNAAAFLRQQIRHELVQQEHHGCVKD